LERGAQSIEFYPWLSPEQLLPLAPPRQKAQRDPLALARYYQSLLDSGQFKSQAELAHHLGVSQARVSVVLRRLKTSPDHKADDQQ